METLHAHSGARLASLEFFHDGLESRLGDLREAQSLADGRESRIASLECEIRASFLQRGQGEQSAQQRQQDDSAVVQYLALTTDFSGIDIDFVHKVSRAARRIIAQTSLLDGNLPSLYARTMNAVRSIPWDFESYAAAHHFHYHLLGDAAEICEKAFKVSRNKMWQTRCYERWFEAGNLAGSDYTYASMAMRRAGSAAYYLYSTTGHREWKEKSLPAIAKPSRPRTPYPMSP